MEASSIDTAAPLCHQNRVAHQELVWNARPVLLRTLFCLVCLLFLNGCMTQALWTGDLVQLSREPSSPNHLALFQTPDHRDIVVQYDELSPWSHSEQRRDYFLRENLSRIKARKKPRFVPAAATNDATAIPVLADAEPPGDSERPVEICAIMSIGGNEFTVYRRNEPPDGPYPLPDYRCLSGNLKLALLTPLTATVDATVLSGFAVYWICYGVARAGHAVLYQSR